MATIIEDEDDDWDWEIICYLFKIINSDIIWWWEGKI